MSRHPALGSVFPHTTQIYAAESGPSVELEELAAEECIATGPDGVEHVGGLREVLAAAAGHVEDEGWVEAVAAAIERERLWTHTGRRSMLCVARGSGERFHASPSRNRASIERHGLDWRHMVPPGIAGSLEAEAPGIFLAEEFWDMAWFIGFRDEPCDVWEVDVGGLWLEGAAESSGGGSLHWALVCEPIPPSRLRLLHRDARPGDLPREP
jgi:hypothetical protein